MDFMLILYSWIFNLKDLRTEIICPSQLMLLLRGDVPKIKQFICVIKEIGQRYHTIMIFKDIPQLMVIHLIINVMFYFNMFVWHQGVSQFLIPLTIL